MKMKEKTLSKASRNYYLNIVTLLPFIFLLASGILVLRYHGGMDYNNETLGFNGHQWLETHQISALVVIPLILTHLWMHAYWIGNLLRLKKGTGKNHQFACIGYMHDIQIVRIYCITRKPGQYTQCNPYN